ncbi:MAG: hypothetical protein WC955_08645 [Elusimicrobiota bacterium]
MINRINQFTTTFIAATLLLTLTAINVASKVDYMRFDKVKQQVKPLQLSTPQSLCFRAVSYNRVQHGCKLTRHFDPFLTFNNDPSCSYCYRRNYYTYPRVNFQG